MLKKILRNPQALIGLFIIVFFLFVALLAHILAPNIPDKIDITLKYQPPSDAYPLGTDALGRCVLSRLIYGARMSMLIALPSLFIIGFFGTILGTAAAYLSGIFERIFIIICDIFMAFPPLVIALSLVGALGTGIINIVVALFFSMWVGFAKVVRTWALAEKNKDYIIASKIVGCSNISIIFKHIIPNVLPRCIVYVSTGVASVIIMVSGFAYLGLGFPAGTTEWGAILNEAQANFYSHPKLLLYPGLCILFAAIGFNLFGEALRDIVTPEGAGQ